MKKPAMGHYRPMTLGPCNQCEDRHSINPDCRTCGGTGRMYVTGPDAKTAKGRAGAATKMLLANRVNCRAMDSCFEAGDGDEVLDILVDDVMGDICGPLAEAVLHNRYYMPPSLINAATELDQATFPTDADCDKFLDDLGSAVEQLEQQAAQIPVAASPVAPESPLTAGRLFADAPLGYLFDVAR